MVALDNDEAEQLTDDHNTTCHKPKRVITFRDYARVILVKEGKWRWDCKACESCDEKVYDNHSEVSEYVKLHNSKHHSVKPAHNSFQ